MHPRVTFGGGAGRHVTFQRGGSRGWLFNHRLWTIALAVFQIAFHVACIFVLMALLIRPHLWKDTLHHIRGDHYPETTNYVDHEGHHVVGTPHEIQHYSKFDTLADKEGEPKRAMPQEVVPLTPGTSPRRTFHMLIFGRRTNVLLRDSNGKLHMANIMQFRQPIVYMDPILKGGKEDETAKVPLRDLVASRPVYRKRRDAPEATIDSVPHNSKPRIMPAGEAVPNAPPSSVVAIPKNSKPFIIMPAKKMTVGEAAPNAPPSSVEGVPKNSKPFMIMPAKKVTEEVEEMGDSPDGHHHHHHHHHHFPHHHGHHHHPHPHPHPHGMMKIDDEVMPHMETGSLPFHPPGHHPEHEHKHKKHEGFLSGWLHCSSHHWQQRRHHATAMLFVWLSLCFSCCLLYGAVTRQSVFLLPYLGSQMVCVFFFVIWMIHGMHQLPHMKQWIASHPAMIFRLHLLAMTQRQLSVLYTFVCVFVLLVKLNLLALVWGCYSRLRSAEKAARGATAAQCPHHHHHHHHHKRSVSDSVVHLMFEKVIPEEDEHLLLKEEKDDAAVQDASCDPPPTYVKLEEKPEQNV